MVTSSLVVLGGSVCGGGLSGCRGSLGDCVAAPVAGNMFVTSGVVSLGASSRHSSLTAMVVIVRQLLFHDEVGLQLFVPRNSPTTPRRQRRVSD